MPTKLPRPTFSERFQRWTAKYGHFSNATERRLERVGRADHNRRARERGYPTLVRFFERDDHAYISLLMFRPTEAIDGVKALLAECPDPEVEVCGLLSELDWRFHTIAVTAVLLGVATPKTCAALWEAADCGSWASPQLIATAYLCDAEFVARATERLRTGFPIDPQRIQELDTIDLTTQAGPVIVNRNAVSAKAISALVFCCNELREAPDSLKTLIQNDLVQSLLAQDTREHGDQIARRFLDRVNETGIEIPVSGAQAPIVLTDEHN